MSLNKGQKKVVQVVGLLAIIALVLTSLAPALAVMLNQ
jgi:hypothetical protein